MVRNKRDINIGKVIQSVAENYLSLNIAYSGHITYDHILENAINDMSAFLTTFSNSIFGDCLFDIADKIIAKNKGFETLSTSIPGQLVKS
jgi:MinD-like ATPase involved in chromosome partitioning or flagellar assembly